MVLKFPAVVLPRKRSLSAIFGKIDNKSCNHKQAFQANTVDPRTEINYHFL